MKNLILLAVLTAALCATGCSGRPKELPKTWPCTITVTKDGTPLPNVQITLLSTSQSGGWVSSGESVSGPVTIKTRWNNYECQGAPAGTYCSVRYISEL